VTASSDPVVAAAPAAPTVVLRNSRIDLALHRLRVARFVLAALLLEDIQ
jgi:hypothetical protein